MTDKQKIAIMGAAGRDFYNFNVYFRENAAYDVVGFTATQIPNIEGRLYPGSIAGALYPNGIPIFPEDGVIPLIDEPTVRVRHDLESTVDPTLKDFIADKFKNK